MTTTGTDPRLPALLDVAEALKVLLAEAEWIRDHPSAAARHPDNRSIEAARVALARLEATR